MTRRRKPLETAAWVAALAISCAGDDPPADEDGTTAADGMTSTAATTADDDASGDGMPTSGTGEATGGTADGGTADSDGETTAAPDCPEDGAPEGREVALTLRNDRAEAIFVTAPAFCADAHARIDSRDGGLWPVGPCTPTCTSIVAGTCECPEMCETPALIRIEAGATHEITWDGVLYFEHLLSEECNACGVAPDCRLGESAPAALLVATATAATAASDCTDGTGATMVCECPDGADSCGLWGSVADPFELGVQEPFDYPKITAVELIFSME